MSAHLLVDLSTTTVNGVSLPGAATVSPSGQLCGLSGTIVGDIVDLQHGNTNCNIWVAGRGVVASGGPIIGIQTSRTTNSGDFTDPTSGYQANDLPSWISSGGLFRFGSTGPVPAAQIQSGFLGFGHFVRPDRYARLTFVGGTYVGPIQAGLVTQARTIGSGGGFTFSPGSGTVSV